MYIYMCIYMYMYMYMYMYIYMYMCVFIYTARISGQTSKRVQANKLQWWLY